MLPLKVLIHFLVMQIVVKSTKKTFSPQKTTKVCRDFFSKFNLTNKFCFQLTEHFLMFLPQNGICSQNCSSLSSSTYTPKPYLFLKCFPFENLPQLAKVQAFWNLWKLEHMQRDSMSSLLACHDLFLTLENRCPIVPVMMCVSCGDHSGLEY